MEPKTSPTKGDSVCVYINIYISFEDFKDFRGGGGGTCSCS
jgi:hypothetical protein